MGSQTDTACLTSRAVILQGSVAVQAGPCAAAQTPVVPASCTRTLTAQTQTDSSPTHVDPDRLSISRASIQLGRIRCQKVWAAMTTSAARVRAGQQAERSWLARSCPQH